MSDQRTHQEPWAGLLARIVDQITPLFLTDTVDPATARLHAIGAIEAYTPESPADVVSAARVLAFSMATLDALGIAAAQDLTPAQKLRYFGRANALNRSALQTERAMTQRRRAQRDIPPAKQPETIATEQPAAHPPVASALDFADDEVAAAMVEEAMAEFRATRASRPVAEHARQADPERSKPAIQASTSSGAGRNASHKDNLLQHSAIHRVVAMTHMPMQGSAPTTARVALP